MFIILVYLSLYKNIMDKYCNVYGCRYSWSHTTLGHECGSCNQFGHGQYECGNSEAKKILSNMKNELPQHLQCIMKGCQYKKHHITSRHKCSSCSDNHSSYDCPKNNKNNKNIVDISYIITCPICKAVNNISSSQKKIYGSTDLCCVCIEKNIELFLPNCGHICLCLQCANKLNQKPKKEYEKEIIYDFNEDVKQNALSKLKDISGKIYTICPNGMGCCTYVRRNDIGSNLEGFFMHNDDWGQYGFESDRRPLLNDFINGYTQN